MTESRKMINFHYRMACLYAVREIERLARKILAEHPHLDEFVMAMGGVTFTPKNRNVGDGILGLYDRAYFKPLANLIEKWDNYLKMTGEPMRFTATGRKITQWGATDTPEWQKRKAAAQRRRIGHA